MTRHTLMAKNTVVVLVGILLAINPSVTWAHRDCCEGSSWLKWPQDQRQAYVRGFLEGYFGGYFYGCQVATAESKPTEPGFENFPFNKCMDKKWGYAQGTVVLEGEVTRFYKRYPENRNLLIHEVLKEIGKGRSLEDIHRNPPFPPEEAKRR